MFWLLGLLSLLLYLAFRSTTAPVWLPVIGATVGAFVSVFFSFMVKAKHEDRLCSSNLFYLLKLYREDLWNARGWLIKHKAAIRKGSRAVANVYYFPVASWGMQNLTANDIRLISELTNQKVKIELDGELNQIFYSENLDMLPTHLKNSFEHIAVSYNKDLRKLKEGGISQSEGKRCWKRISENMDERIRGVSKAIDCLDEARRQLESRSKITTWKRFFLFGF